MSNQEQLATIETASLATTTGGLSQGLAQRAHAVASERYIDALNAGSPRADKLFRQMQRFGNY
jgi:hypothetical protein